MFDNAEDPADIRPWLPGGAGHVLITSREHRWAEIAAPVEVDVLTRPESVSIFRDRAPRLSEADADQLAAQLGDLPLAVAQAAGFMAETGMTPGEYLGLLANRAGQLLSHGSPVSYPQSLAAVTELIADRLADDDLPAAQLASICAFLAPEPVPEDLFTSAPELWITTWRSWSASPARCPARRRWPRPAPRGSSPARTRRSGPRPGPGTATAPGPGR